MSCGRCTSAVAFVVLLNDMFLPSICVAVLAQVHAYIVLHLGDGIISSGTPGWGLGASTPELSVGELCDHGAGWGIWVLKYEG